MKTVVYMFVFLSGIMSFAQSNVAFDQGNTLYNEGKYQEAISIYESILDNGQHSAEMYYNLGNAYYDKEMNDVAMSRFKQAAAVADTKSDKHKVFHNLVFKEKKEGCLH